MNSRTKNIIVTFLALILFPIYFPLMMRIAGFYVNNAGWEVGEIAAKYKNPNICQQLIVIGFSFGPTGSARRQECIHRYAEETKDATACSLLMPSEYGLSCLGNVWGKIVGPLPCLKTDGKSWVTCNDEESLGDITIDEPQITNCDLYKRRDLKDWCHTERTEKIANTHECNQIQLPSVKDHCEAVYSFNQKNPSLCSAILDEKYREYCEIDINTWLKYPGLRDSFYFGRDVPINEE